MPVLLYPFTAEALVSGGVSLLELNHSVPVNMKNGSRGISSRNRSTEQMWYGCDDSICSRSKKVCMRIQHSVGFQKGQVPMAHLMHKYKTQNTLSIKQTVITAAAPPCDQHRCISKNRRKHSQLLRARTFSFISFSSLLLQRCFEGLKSRTPQLNLSHI